MFSGDFSEKSSNDLSYKNIGVKKIVHHDNCLFIVLDNEQKLLAVENRIYDVSEYEHLVNYLVINGREYAVLRNLYLYLVDLETMEVVYHDKDAYSIFKNDENTLKVLMQSNGKKIFNLNTKEYFNVPNDYEYEDSLGDNLYIFREKKSEKDFYNLKRYVLNLDGKELLKDIEGYIYYKDGKLVIIKKDEINIIEMDDETFEVKTVKKGGPIIATPLYFEGIVVTVLENSVNIYNLNLEVIKTIKVEGLTKVSDITLNGNVLHLIVPYTVDDDEKYKRVYVGLKAGNVVSHRFLEGYPYWTPTTFIGNDSNDLEMKDYYFYDEDLNLIRRIRANACVDNIDDNKESIFLLKRKVDNKIQTIIFNSASNALLERDYDSIKFSGSIPYGYGVDFERKTMDFFDRDLNIVIPNFEYENYGLNPRHIYNEFSYYIMNGYVCIQKHFVDDFGESRYRTTIYRVDGEVILDSIRERVGAIGKFFQITSDGNNQFLNTETGEIGTLVISAPVDELNKVQVSQLEYRSNTIRIGTSDVTPLDSPSKRYIKRLYALFESDKK